MVDLVQLGVCDIMTGHYWNVGDWWVQELIPWDEMEEGA